MTSFDLVCACEHETETRVCLCTKPKEEAKQRCADCMMGRHVMKDRKILDQVKPRTT